MHFITVVKDNKEGVAVIEKDEYSNRSWLYWVENPYDWDIEDVEKALERSVKADHNIYTIEI